MYIYELKFLTIDLPTTTLQSAEMPEIGDTITGLLPNDLPEELTEALIICGLNHETMMAVASHRYIKLEEHPLLEVDLHLKTIRCKRCGTVITWEVAPLIKEEGELLDQTTIIYAVQIIQQYHSDCEYPICLN